MVSRISPGEPKLYTHCHHLSQLPFTLFWEKKHRVRPMVQDPSPSLPSDLVLGETVDFVLLEQTPLSFVFPGSFLTEVTRRRDRSFCRISINFSITYDHRRIHDLPSLCDGSFM